MTESDLTWSGVLHAAVDVLAQVLDLHGLVVGVVGVDIADGDPRALKRLSVQFRGMSYPEQEITVSGEVTEVKGDEVKLDLIASQGDSTVIRNATATLDTGS